jgi:hypothetical protein
MTGRRFASDRLTMDAAVVFALFAVFTVSVIMALLAGAGVYRSVAEQISESFSQRTAEAYIISKIRHADGLDSSGSLLVAVTKIDEADALALYEEYDGGCDVTYIYWRDGWLCELFAGADETLDPDMGERIIQTEGFTVTQNGSLLTIDTGSGRQYVTLRSIE